MDTLAAREWRLGFARRYVECWAQREMAGSAMRLDVEASHRGLDLGTERLRPRTAGAEAAAGRWVGSGGQLALQAQLRLVARVRRIGHRDSVEQGRGVRVGGSLVHLAAWPILDQLPQVHDSDPIGEIPQHR